MSIANGSSSGIVVGGIYSDGTLTVRNSTISGNFGSPRGGGIYNSPSGTLTLSNSVVSGNSTTNAGGGISDACDNDEARQNSQRSPGPALQSGRPVS